MSYRDEVAWLRFGGDTPVNVDRERLRAQLIVHEGLRLFPYTDTVGKLTIGVGRNISDIGISRVEALDLLDHDIDRSIQDLHQHIPWVHDLDPVRQAVLVDMAFNMGWPRLSEFRNTLAAFKRKDWVSAAEGMRASKWAKQVGQRAVRLRKMVLSGEWPNELNA